MAIRILIADDHGVLRAGLRALLQAEPDFQVVGEAGDGDSTWQCAVDLRPDLILLDISMPGMNSIELVRRLTAELPGIRILILSFYEDAGLLKGALRAGAAGYITKRAVNEELTAGIRAVAHGAMYVHPSLMQAMADDLASLPPPSKETTLTNREIQILKLIASGFTNRQIAKQLNRSVRTIENHRANLTEKLGLHTRADLVRYVDQHFLVASNATPSAPAHLFTKQ